MRMYERLGQSKRGMKVVRQARVTSTLDLLLCESHGPCLLAQGSPPSHVRQPGSRRKDISSGFIWLLFSLFCFICGSRVITFLFGCALSPGICFVVKMDFFPPVDF